MPAIHLNAPESVNQHAPASTYVYLHTNVDGVPFFVEVGTKRDAWEAERPHLWTRYVDKHLNGLYLIKIFAEGMPDSDARVLRDEVIRTTAQTVVNLSNLDRPIDVDASDRYWKLKKQIWPMINEARSIESHDAGTAIIKYSTAIAIAQEVAEIQPEGGLVGQLLDEERAEFGLSGVIQALDRLTLCLIRLDRNKEAKECAFKYFQTFRRDRLMSTAPKILKRVGLHVHDDA